MIDKKNFHFELPDRLIAQKPLENRDTSKLLVLDRLTDKIEHKNFIDLIDYLDEGDCLVLNNTKVIPARIFGIKQETTTKIEFLLLKENECDIWEVLIKPAKKLKVGSYVNFGNGILSAEILKIEENGNRLVKFSYKGIFKEILSQIGEMPLPHYITEKLDDENRYQTIYAKNEGSVAAPTAGLHFTDDLIYRLKQKKINIAYVTLHVGIGTFRPVKVDNILEHNMHEEYYEVLEEQANTINEAKKNNKKVIAVGTTSCRTLETLANVDGFLKFGTGTTNIFIYPEYKFKIVDGIITNFHLPESTLIMLISAFHNRESILKAYEIAIDKEYRFFSFGDAMFIK